MFPPHEEVIAWAHDVGKKLGYVVVTTRSDRGGSARKVLMALGCECSGTFKPSKSILKRKGTTSRNCQCPFKLRGRPRRDDETWRLTVLCGLHNYEANKTLEGHAFIGRLSSEEKNMVGEMVKTG